MHGLAETVVLKLSSFCAGIDRIETLLHRNSAFGSIVVLSKAFAIDVLMLLKVSVLLLVFSFSE